MSLNYIQGIYIAIILNFQRKRFYRKKIIDLVVKLPNNIRGLKEDGDGINCQSVLDDT